MVKKLGKLKMFIKLLKNNLINEIVKNSFVAFFLRIVGLIIGYLFVLFVARKYNAEILGMFSLSVTIIQILTLVNKLGLDTLMVRFSAEFSVYGEFHLLKDLYIKVFKISAFLSTFSMFCLFILSNSLANNIFRNNDLSIYLKISSFAILPLVLLSINSESIRGLRKIKEYAFLKTVSIFLFAIMMLFLLYFKGKHNYDPIISYVIAVYISCFISIIVWFKSSKIYLFSMDKKDFNADLTIRKILGISIPMLLASSLSFVMGWTDIVLLSFFRSMEEVGVYHVVLKIAMLMSMILTAVNSITMPKFAQSFKRNNLSELNQILNFAVLLIFWISVVVAVVIVIFSSFILNIFGSKFVVGKLALFFLIIGQLVNSIGGLAGPVLQMTGKEVTFQNIVIIAVIINFLLNVLFIPKYGINGAAFASAFSMSLWNVLSMIYIYKYYKIVVNPFKFSLRFN